MTTVTTNTRALAVDASAPPADAHTKTVYKQFDALYDKQKVTMDPKQREQVLFQMAEVFRDEAPMIFLHQVSYLYGVGRRVHGWEPTNTEPILVWDASVE